MKSSILSPKNQLITPFFISLFLLAIISSCSTDNVDDVEEVEEVEEVEDENGGPDFDVIVQFSEKEVFKNELSGRIMAPDFQVSLFSNTTEGGHFLKSILYQSEDSQLVIFRGEGENTGRSLVFPMANNEVSPFGCEFVINEGVVTQLNIVEQSPSQGSYTILYNLYTSFNSGSETKSQVQKAAASARSFRKASTMEEKTPDEQIKEVVETLTTPGWFLFDNSLADIKRRLEEIPSDIKEQLGELRDKIVEFVEQTKKAFNDLNEVDQELETAKKEPIDENLTEEEKTITDETKSVQVQLQYPNNGMTIDGSFYELTQAYYDGNYLHFSTHRGIYCESEGDSTLPLHDLIIFFSSFSPTLPEGVYDYEELSSSYLNIYTGGSNGECHYLTPQVVSGTVEIINEDTTVVKFDFRTNKGFDAVGSFQGTITSQHQ